MFSWPLRAILATSILCLINGSHKLHRGLVSWRPQWSAFIHFTNTNGQNQPHMSLHAHRNQLKGARKFVRRRPKKKTPAKIYPSPTPYYPSIQEYFGAPCEYYAVPCAEARELISGGAMSRLVTMLKDGTDTESLDKVLNESPEFKQELNHQVDLLKSIAQRQGCDVTQDLSIYFDHVLNKTSESGNLIDRLHTYKKIHEHWKRRQMVRYHSLFKVTFWRLRQIAFKLKATGLPLEEFNKPELWHRYGVFKHLPKCTMVDRYMAKHGVALGMDISTLYFMESKKRIASVFDGKNPKDSKCKPITRIDDKLVERITHDLQELGVIDAKEPNVLNCSRIDEFQREYTTPQAQKAYAIRDFYLTLKYPNYSIVNDPRLLESYINHDYRIKTLERDLLQRYQGWLKSGAMYKYPQPTGRKYQALVKWHLLSRAQRRHLVSKYIETVF